MNPFNPSISTPSGIWNPLVWILVFLLSLLIAYAIYLKGEKQRKKGMQEEIFLSGNKADGNTHIKASNIGWGYLEAMKGYYKLMRDIHTGIINDYVGWFLGVLATMLLIFLFWGGAQ